MTAMYQWLADHWLTVSILLGIAVATAYVFSNRKRLFYKE